MSPRARGWALAVLAVVLGLGAGVAYLEENRLALTGESTVAEVVEASRDDPVSMTVRFTTDAGEPVVATTGQVVVNAPEGAGLPVRYDPDEPTRVVDERYRTDSPLSTVLVGAATVAVGTAVVTGRRDRQRQRAAG